MAGLKLALRYLFQRGVFPEITLIWEKEGSEEKPMRSFLFSCVIPLLLGVFPVSAGVLYDNGAIVGTQGSGAPPINGGGIVTDSFNLLAGDTITGTANLGLWVTGGDTPSTVDWSITTGAFGGAIEASGTATWGLTFLFTNAFGFDIYDASFAIPSVSVAAGTYWLQLQNAAASGGGSTFWDVSNGPSSAFFDSVVVPIQSESFQILGDVTTTDTVPEPGGIPLTGAAITLLYSLLRKRHLAHHGRVC